MGTNVNQMPTTIENLGKAAHCNSYNNPAPRPSYTSTQCGAEALGEHSQGHTEQGSGKARTQNQLCLPP